MIEHTTLMSNVQIGSNDVAKVIAIYNAILSAYTWETGSEVYNIANIGAIYGKYYFTASSYIKIGNYTPHNYGVKIEIVTPSSTKTISLQDPYYMFSLGKTSKGICICAYSGGKDTRDPHFYNLYVGEVTHLDGTTTKGCIYVNDDNSYIVATDKGISEESAFVSTIDNTRKAQLVAAADSTTGAIFNDTYMMFNTPLQYNKMKILGTGKTFLLGKSLCLAD
jgi:hypothetical protein